MIDLGQAPEQKETNNGPIPPKSIVLVRMEIRHPKAGKQAQDDPEVTVFSSGLRGLDCEFHVVGGKYVGTKIWENLFLPPGMQTITLTKGQEGACNGAFAKMRAMIEASRNLDPNDPAANRSINSWFDLHDLTFPVKVGVQKPKPTDIYINNSISKVLVPGDEHFDEVSAGGEVITDEPIPELPKASETAQPQSGGAPSWTQGVNAKQQQPEQAQPPKQQQINAPAWAKAANA